MTGKRPGFTSHSKSECMRYGNSTTNLFLKQSIVNNDRDQYAALKTNSNITISVSVRFWFAVSFKLCQFTYNILQLIRMEDKNHNYFSFSLRSLGPRSVAFFRHDETRVPSSSSNLNCPVITYVRWRAPW